MLGQSLLVGLLAATLFACDSSPNLLPQVSEMKAELRALNDKLQEPPIEPMTVFAKPEGAYMEFRYKPKEREAFVQRIKAMATEGGYTLSAERVDPVVVLTMCSPKARHRRLHVAQGGDGVVSLSIRMSRPPLLYSPAC